MQPLPDEAQLRIDLAASFQIAAFMDWHEGIANHFSAAVSPDGRYFLLNPKWRHFSRIRASDLLLLDSRDSSVIQQADAPDPTAWHLHGALHARLPHIRCIMHLHLPYATALSCLDDPEIKPIDQTTARFFRRVAIDHSYGGMVDSEDEGARVARLLARHDVVLMGNHGALVAGHSIAEAFDTMYHLERACRTLIWAYSTGKPLRVLSDEVAERTAGDWARFAHSGFTHFEETKKVLEASGAVFR